MQAGDLRARVGFYKRAAAPSGTDYGVPEGEFPSTPEFECAANIKPRLGGEQVLAQRLTGVNLVNITVRQSSRTKAVDTAWRIKDQKTDVLYNIRSIIDPYGGSSQHGLWLEMLAEKGGAS